LSIYVDERVTAPICFTGQSVETPGYEELTQIPFIVCTNPFQNPCERFFQISSRLGQPAPIEGPTRWKNLSVSYMARARVVVGGSICARQHLANDIADDLQ
jgi:hypothetical protein